MAEETSPDITKLEKRICNLEHTLQLLRPYIAFAEESLLALEKLVEVSNRATDAEIAVLLRQVALMQGLAPKGLTKGHLLKALLEKEHDVNLHFPKKTKRGPVPQR